MIVRHWLRIVALLALSSVAGPALAQATEADGLVKVTPRKMEMAWLRPGADFRPYTKVMVDKTQVAFLPNWRKDYNLNAAVGNWVSEAQANQIMAVAQTNFDQIFVDAFKKAGYEVVTTTGPDVLRVNSGILDLSVNAPLGGSTGQTNWIISAGEAALIVEVRDSTTNALLGRVADRRETQNIGRQLATTAANIYDFRNLFSLWSGICVNALAELKAVSPIPKNLQAGQSL